MKFHKVIEKLSENGNRTFICESRFGKTFVAYLMGGYFFVDIFDATGEYIPQKYDGGAFNGHITTLDNWKEAIGTYNSAYLRYKNEHDELDVDGFEDFKEFVRTMDDIFGR